VTDTPAWRQDIETSRLAGLAIAKLRRHAAGQSDGNLPAEQVAALVAEFDKNQALLAASWRQAANKLEAVPHNPTALTGPYWYGQGWDDAVHHLRDLADGMDPSPHGPTIEEQQ
jgi:hypothetical protein